MRIPKSLETLADQGVIQEVVRPLMSGKEAQIYLVVSEDYYCAAKIYKDAQNRSFKNKADYVEGRKVRNSRDQRAISKGTKYGKEKDEDTWKATEVEMIYRLRDAGVRVPEPYMFIDGVLIMELVVDENDHPAPRLGDLQFTPGEATKIYQHLIHETARMLSAGVVHGDLSDFNVLLAADGPVIIDFPQAVNAASNQNARSLLLRDVNNLHRFLQRWVPGARRLPYAEEMWSLYESNQLTPETRLTGRYKGASGPVDTRAVLSLIGDANRDEARRRQAQGRSTVGLSPVPSNEGHARGARSSGSSATYSSTVNGSARHGTEAKGSGIVSEVAAAGDAFSPGAAVSPVPARRREYIVEKPAPRGRPPQDRARNDRPQGGARNDRPHSSGGRPQSGARNDRPQSGGRPQSGARNDRPQSGARSDRPRNDGQAPHERHPGRPSNDVRRTSPPRRPGANSMPKRGDGVQASTYVSPEARKAKVKALTPRDGSGGATSRTANTGPGAGARPGPGASSASAKGGARDGSAGGSGRGRRRRPRRRSAE